MSEVHRYQVVTMLSVAGATIGYDPHGPDVVMAAEFDRVTAERDALQQRLTAADERADVLEGLLNRALELLRGTHTGDLFGPDDWAIVDEFLAGAALKPVEVRCNIPACDYKIDMDQN